MKRAVLRLAKTWRDFWFAVRMEQAGDVDMDENGFPVWVRPKSKLQAIVDVTRAWYHARTCRHEWRDMSFASREHGCIDMVCDKCGKQITHWLY